MDICINFSAENPDKSTGMWCMRCGASMRFNVPRLGPDGGYVHNNTNNLSCADQPQPHIGISFDCPPPSIS